jgi:hypothetical protein
MHGTAGRTLRWVTHSPLVEEGAQRMSSETEQLAWLVLEAVNRTQARGTTVRLVVPSAPEVTRELDPTLAEHEILASEEYLLTQGHIAPANIGLTWGTYTITPAGLEWLKGGISAEEAALESALRAELEEERHRLEMVEQELDEVNRELAIAQDPPGTAQAAGEVPAGAEEPRSSPGGLQESSEQLWDTSEFSTRGALTRPWWRKVFGR